MINGNINANSGLEDGPQVTLAHLFRQQAKRHPDKVAIQTPIEKITFAELDQITDFVACKLIQTIGKERTQVGLFLEHGINMVVGMLSVLKSGHIYVPLDTHHPKDWLIEVISSAQIKNILCSSSTTLFSEIKDLAIININKTEKHNIIENLPQVDPSLASYILFTSGSTGKPKGVVQSQENVIHHIRNYSKVVNVTSDDKILQFASYGFDASVIDTYTALLNGATLYLASLRDYDFQTIRNLVLSENISIYHSTPTVFRALFGDIAKNLVFPSIRVVVLGGEETYFSDLKLFNQHFLDTSTFINLLGSTECSFTMRFEIKGHSEIIDSYRVPVGVPVDGVEVLLLDENGNKTDIEGELIYRSKFIALGYWNLPEQTKTVFLKYSQDSKEKLYRTGDIIRKIDNGFYEFLGRKDMQIKIKGNRVETGHIVSKLREHPMIENAVVLVKENNDKEKYLFCFVKLYDRFHAQLEPLNIKKYLKSMLPDFLIPEKIVVLENLPMNVHGKIDRSALENIARSLAQENRMEKNNFVSLSEAEKKLIDIWAKTLNVPMENIDIETSFFDYGGDSLRAMKAISKINELFDISVSLRQFFYEPKISSIASQIREMKKEISLPLLTKKPKQSFYPLSYAQKRIYFACLFADNLPVYNISHAFHISGDLDISRLQKSISSLILKHEAFKLKIIEDNGKPVFFIEENPDLSNVITIIDLMDSEKDKINKTMQDFLNRKFDLSVAPLIRLQLIKTEHNAYILQFSVHHIIVDAWSLGIIVEELFNIYKNKSFSLNDSHDVINYSDYAIWDNDALVEVSRERQKKFWEEHLSSDIPKLNFPADFPKKINRTFLGDQVEFVIPDIICSKLKKFCGQYNITPFMVFVGIFRALINKYTGVHDIVIGSPAACRLTPSLENMIGCFVNTLPLKNSISASDTFIDLINTERDVMLAAFENQDYPIENIIREKNLNQNGNKQPLFDVVFSMQNTENEKLISTANFEVESLKIKKEPVQRKYSKFFDFMLTIVPEGNIYKGIIEYETDLFLRKRIDNFASHFINLLTKALDNPEISILSHSILSSEEIKHLTGFHLYSSDTFPRQETIISLFEKSVKNYPNRLAVKFSNTEYSYKVLDEKSSKMANYLVKNGVHSGGMIALLLGRSIEQVISILAVLKTGNAYVPLDIAHPDERIQWIIQDCNPCCLITASDFITKAGKVSNTVIIDNLIAEIENESDAFPFAHCSPESLAYVIYTSGTTGKPKGVLIEHKNVVQLLLHNPHAFVFKETDTWVMFHSYCFDVSVWEMYGALLYGGKLVIISDIEVKDTNLFVEVLHREKVTVLCQTPTAFQNVIQADLSNNNINLDLRYVIFAGEALMPEKLKLWHNKYPKTKLINMYGITEVTVHATYKEITEHEIKSNTSNIGKPLLTYSMYVVDKDNQLVPIGVPGELLVGGFGVARGYLNRDDLTAQRFIDNPVNSNERVYRSGDLVRYLFNGELEYLGRIDHQIKLHGYRIELPEIEQAMISHPRISDARVLLKDSETRGKFLCAYFVGDVSLTVDKVKGFISQKLPYYMVPAHIVKMDVFPMTVNGKIDNKALPEPEFSSGKREKIQPKNETEQSLVDIWCKVLNTDFVNIDDNIFNLGADSIQAMKAVFLAKGLFSLADVFKYPILADLAEHIANTKKIDFKYIVNLQEEGELLFENKTATLLCIPYGGGDAADYKPLADELEKIAPHCRVLAVQMPGLGRKTQEILPFEVLAEKIVDEVQVISSGNDIIIYSHCVGVALGAAINKVLKQRGLSVRLFLIGGTFLPEIDQNAPNLDPWENTSDDDIIETLRNLGWNDKNLENDIMSSIISNFRQDVRSYRKYFYQCGTQIDANYCYIVGELDKVTENYKERSSDVSMGKIIVLPKSDHYFIKTQTKMLAMNVAKLVSQNCERAYDVN